MNTYFPTFSKLTFAFFFFFIVCTAPAQTKKTAVRTNTVILLDLSDRLLTPLQAKRDLTVIREILDLFEEKAKRAAYIACKDAVRIVVAPQQTSPYQMVNYKNLSVDMNTIKMDKKRFVKEELDLLYTKVAKLYEEACQGSKHSDYSGADIWGYMKSFIQFDLSEPTEKYDVRNILIVLTDGYLDFEDYKNRRQEGNRFASTQFVNNLAKQKSNWKTSFEKNDFGILWKEGKVLQPAVELYTFEVQPKADFHFEVLEAVWHKWAKEMGANTSQIYEKSTTDHLLLQLKGLR